MPLPAVFLGKVIESPVPDSAAALHETWGAHWQGIEGRDKDSEKAVRSAIEILRDATLTRLAELD